MQYVNQWIFVTLLAAAVAGCGGGGSSGGNTGTGGTQPGKNNGQPADNDPVAVLGFDATPTDTESCAAELDEVLVNGRAPYGRLENLNDSCDYLVQRSVSILGDVTVDAGVTFTLRQGVTLKFEDGGSRASSIGTGNAVLSGNAEAPIRFLPAVQGEKWGEVIFSGSSATLSNVLFAGGGASSSRNGSASVRVDGGLADFSMTSSVIRDSAGNGLNILSRTATLELFYDNVFSGNTGFGLEITGDTAFAGLRSDNDYDGKDRPNGRSGILISASRIDGAVIRNPGVAYVVSDPVQFNDNFGISGSLLEAGVTIRFPEARDVELIETTLNGTAESPIILSGLSGDDTSIWGGVELGRGNVLRHVRIINAGGGSASTGGALSTGRFGDIRDSLLENIAIVNPQGWGIFCAPRTRPGDNETAEIAGVEITNAVIGDIRPDCPVMSIAAAVDEPGRIDTSQCAQTLTGDTGAIMTPFQFQNTDAECDYLIS